MAEHPEPAAHKEPRPRRESARLAAVVVLTALASIFAVSNLDEVKVNWVVSTSKTPLIIVIVIALLAGIALDRLAIHLGRRRKAKAEQ
jgi:uncharacterized integral membrane protein